MATQHGIPGEWARVRGTVLSLWPLFVAFTCLGAFAAALAIGRATLLFAILFFVSLAAVVVLWRKGVRRVASFFVGARGEERVAGLLATLPADYDVFHDFVAAGTPVDHVVVGAAGVYSIETKNWRGAITLTKDRNLLVDGHVADRSPIRQTIREADAVRAELAKAGWEGEITPVLCFASDTFDRGAERAGSALLINAKELCGWLKSRPEVLAPAERERLVQLMAAR